MELTVRRRGSLLPVVLRETITDAQFEWIRDFIAAWNQFNMDEDFRIEALMRERYPELMAMFDSKRIDNAIQPRREGIDQYQAESR